MQPRLHTGRSPRAAVLAPNITCILDKILDRGWHRGGIGGQRGCIGGEYVHSLTRAPPWAGVYGSFTAGGCRPSVGRR